MIAPVDTPTIAGTVAGQTVTGTSSINPLSGVTITDPNLGSLPERVTVTPSDALAGTLTDPSAAMDGSTVNGRVYTVSGTAAKVQAILRALVFTPTVQALPGEITAFNLTVTNIAGQTAMDTTASVVQQAPSGNHAPTLITPTLSFTVGEGQTLQNLYGQLLANAQDVDTGDQAQLTISTIGLSNTAGFAYLDPAHQLLTYTADGYNSKQPTDNFSYTVADPHGATVSGTVNVTVAASAGQPTALGTPGDDMLPGNGAGQLIFAGRGNDIIRVNGAKGTVYGGPGNNAVTLNGAQQTVVLQQAGTDDITGFNVQNDVLDLRQVLAEAQINLGGDFSELSNYVRMTDAGNDATLSLTSAGQNPGYGATLAVLHGVGPNVTLNTLINDHALAIT